MKHNYLKQLFTALLLLCTTIASAYDFEVGGIYYNILSEEEKTVEVINGTNKYTGNVVIPGSVIYNGSIYSVTSIGKAAFSNSDLTSIEISNSVRKIGSNAFNKSSYLKKISIPESVEEIGNFCFSGCNSLKEVVFEDGDKNLLLGNSKYSDGVGGGLFENVNVETIYIGRNLIFSDNNDKYYRKQHNAMFAHWTSGSYSSIKKITIGNKVKKLPDYLFEDCANLVSIVSMIPIEYLCDLNYKNCTGFNINNVELYVPYNTKDVYSTFNGWSDFANIGEFINYGDFDFAIFEDRTANVIGYNSNTGELEIPDNIFVDDVKYDVNRIGKDLFRGQTDIKSVKINDNITLIDDYAFYNCNNLVNITIGNSVKKIGRNAFFNCSSLTSIVIPNCVTSIDMYAFKNCSGITNFTVNCEIPPFVDYTNSPFAGVSATLYVPYGSKETYAATKGWGEFTNIVELEPVTEITVTINEYGCATYCSQYALDFSEVEGLKAYSAIGYKPSTQTVTLARVMTTGAGQGIFIKGEPGEYIVPIIDDFDEYTLNLLVGTLEQTTVNSTDGEMSNYRFTIAEGDDAPKFYPFADNTTFSANRAYLQIPTAWLPATAQKSLNIRFDDGEATDIEELKGESGEVKTVYDLQGRVVENPTNGIYIVNGKKVIIK